MAEPEKTHAWSHCPVIDILRLWGNTPRPHTDGSFVAGHEPLHVSRSGACVSVDAERNVWFCSSCEQGGGPLALAVSILNSRIEARRWLTARFGPPAGQRRARSTRRSWSTVVIP